MIGIRVVPARVGVAKVCEGRVVFSFQYKGKEFTVSSTTASVGRVVLFEQRKFRITSSGTVIGNGFLNEDEEVTLVMNPPAPVVTCNRAELLELVSGEREEVSLYVHVLQRVTV